MALLRKMLHIAFVIAVLFFVALAVSPSGTGPTRADAVGRPGPPAPFEAGPLGDDLPAKGKFLVASRKLADPRFRETVVLLLDYSSEGAAGIIINRPTEVPLTELLPGVPELGGRADIVYYGGPVEGHRMLMLMRADKKPEESGRVFGNVYVSASRNTLKRMIASGKTARQLRVYAGYAGWLPRQLDREVSRGDWLITSADAASIFEKKPSQVWRELYRQGSAIQVWNRQWQVFSTPSRVEFTRPL